MGLSAKGAQTRLKMGWTRESSVRPVASTGSALQGVRQTPSEPQKASWMPGSRLLQRRLLSASRG